MSDLFRFIVHNNLLNRHDGINNNDEINCDSELLLAMNTHLVCDVRETAIIEALRAIPESDRKFVQAVQQLPVADFQIMQGGKVVWAIERKTASDLVSSVYDNRYREQKVRLQQSFAPHQIVYIIEGKIDTKSVRSSRNVSTAWGAIVDMQMRDDIKLFRTENAVQTAYLLNKLSGKTSLAHAPTPLSDNHEEEVAMAHNNYSVEALAGGVKNQIGRGDKLKELNMCFAAQLALIPGMSPSKANDLAPIIQSWKNVGVMIGEFDPNPNDGKRRRKPLNPQHCLANIALPSNKGRRLGPNLSEKICEMWATGQVTTMANEMSTTPAFEKTSSPSHSD